MLGYGRRPEPPPYEDWWKTAWEPDSADRVWEFMNDPELADVHAATLREWLQVEAGQSVLDVGCGSGRLSVPMARSEVRVIGLDYSAAQLARAKKRALETGVACEWVKADMRDCPVRGPVDAAFISAGTFGSLANRAEHAKALQAIAKVLKPGGRLYIEHLNRETLPYHRKVLLLKQEADRELSLALEMDYWTNRLAFELTLIREGAYPETLKMSLQIFSLHEYAELAEGSGLILERATGGLGRNVRPYIPNDSRLLGVVYVKKGATKPLRPGAAPGIKPTPGR